MPSVYITARAKIQNQIEMILENVKKNDLDYNSILDFVAFENKTSKSKVQEILDFTIKVKGYILTGDNIITISDKDIPGWLKEHRAKEWEKEKIIKDMDKTMKNIENSAKNQLMEVKSDI